MFKLSMEAGHAGFGVTPGKRPFDGSMYEWDFSNAVVKYIIEELSHYEDVATHRVDDPSGRTDVPLQTRTNRANDWGSNVHLSIHANAIGTTWNSVRGIETYVYKTSLKEAFALATKVQAELISATGCTNRGVKAGDLHMVRETAMTAILIEGPFMSNRDDLALLKSDSFRKKFALAIVAGLVQQYKLRKRAVKPVTSQDDTLWRVVTGSFDNKQNAEDRAAALKKAGFDSFLLPYKK
jgi:N-acetylmuramoyl-L-alanine amidase